MAEDPRDASSKTPPMRRAKLASLERKTGGGLRIDRPMPEQRAAFARLMQLTEVGMPEHEHEPVEVAGVACLRVRPQACASADPLLFLHGGGYSLGSPQTHRPLVARIAEALGREALLPDYRLAPEHPCPAGLDDVLAIWRSLPEPHRRQTILAGDSAGGGLALAMAMTLRDAGEPLPAGLVLLSPWTDLSISGESVDRLAEHEIMLTRQGLTFMASRYAGALEPTDVRVSPLFGDYAGLPPLLIQVGGHEVLLDDARRVAQRAESAGVATQLQVFEGEHHVFQAMPLRSSATAAIAAIGAWVAGLGR
jgi:epsilon-lactone hydrolase